MAEKEITSVLTNWEVVGVIIAFISLPFAWLWARLTSQHHDNKELAKDLAEHRLHVAETTFSKDEVRAIVEGTTQPIRESVDRIEKAVDRLTDRRSTER